MVLLSGLNYDFSGQQTSELTEKVGVGGLTLKVKNTEGFEVDDYIVIDPKTETAEILKIAVVVDTMTLTVSASKFSHALGSNFYRIPYNQMQFYSSTELGGTYTLIAASTLEMAYAGLYTNYSHTSGTSALYYKRTFLNETTSKESDIGEADYWQTGDESLIIDAEELRGYLLFGRDDPPSPEEMTNIIKLAENQLYLDTTSRDQNFLRTAAFLIAKAYVMRGLATKAISKGYVTINVEGRNVTKAYQELVLEAENTMKEYETFIIKWDRSEVGSTNFMEEGEIDTETREAYIWNWTGTTNALSSSRRLYNNNSRRRR